MIKIKEFSCNTATVLALIVMSGHCTADLVLQPDETLMGSGIIAGDFNNLGHVIGTGKGQRIVFDWPWTVSGDGSFENTMIHGTFAPGNSPGVSNGTNQAFAGTIEFELGGTTPGFGASNHDQINDSATIQLDVSSTLKILPFNNFIPQHGDQFVIMTWQTGLVGTFGSTMVDPFFTNNGVSFTQATINTGGSGNLTLTAVVPEPSAFLFLGIISGCSAVSLGWSRWRAWYGS